VNGGRLKAMYIGLVRSVLDYGCVVYGSAAETPLRKLDNIQHQVLRLCTGAILITDQLQHYKLKWGKCHWK